MPNFSAVDICNMALAMVGANLIRSLDEDNKRARTCAVFYPMTRDYLLDRFDWNFARKMAYLQPLSEERVIGRPPVISGSIPDGWYAYQQPHDCITPRDVHPPGSQKTAKWKKFQNMILTVLPPETKPRLYYTCAVESTALFSPSFCTLLATGLALKLAPALAKDQQMTQSLLQQWKMEQAEVFGDDASTGDEYREHDERPEVDTFVYPDRVFLTTADYRDDETSS